MDNFNNLFDIKNPTSPIRPVISAVAKKEQPYIEEWIRWHIALGFDHIYLYDNEDSPTYQNQLSKYSKYLTFTHVPGNHYYKGVQYICLDHYITHYMSEKNNTHSIHLDIDEFIVLKQHNNIKDFIKEFFVDDCGAIGINWRFFGDSGSNTNSQEPVVTRFTKRQKFGDQHVKTLFQIYNFHSFIFGHNVNLFDPYKTKNTKNDIIIGPFNTNQNYDYIQINHYKCKTFQEFSDYYLRGRVDVPIYNQFIYNDINNIRNIFNHYNFNDEEDTTALSYLNFIEKFWSEQKI